MRVAGVIGQAGQQGKGRGKFRAIISQGIFAATPIGPNRLGVPTRPLHHDAAGGFAPAAFLVNLAEKLLDTQAVRKTTPETKKKAELSLGQVQQGGMKQQE